VRKYAAGVRKIVPLQGKRSGKSWHAKRGTKSKPWLVQNWYPSKRSWLGTAVPTLLQAPSGLAGIGWNTCLHPSSVHTVYEPASGTSVPTGAHEPLGNARADGAVRRANISARDTAAAATIRPYLIGDGAMIQVFRYSAN